MDYWRKFDQQRAGEKISDKREILLYVLYTYILHLLQETCYLVASFCLVNNHFLFPSYLLSLPSLSHAGLPYIALTIDFGGSYTLQGVANGFANGNSDTPIMNKLPLPCRSSLTKVIFCSIV